MSELRVDLNIAESLGNAASGLNLPRDIAEADLESHTIPSSWLLSGEARTRSSLLGRTHDKLAYALFWECGATHFKWHYSKDEFLFILSGGVFVTDKNGEERYYGPSDFVFFPAGTDVTWRVPDHVRKIAILKSSVTRPAALMSKVWTKLLDLSGLSSGGGL